MKISTDDYNLLVGLAEFHFKFSEYIRSQDEEMFFRAVDYARTYTKTTGTTFEYWHEDNKKFLNELYNILLKKRNLYDKYLDKHENKEEAIASWKKRKKTSDEDLLGVNKYLSNFIRHSRELNYQEFDSEDWKNFCGICSFIKNDKKFILRSIDLVKKYMGSECSYIKEFDLDANEN